MYEPQASIWDRLESDLAWAVYKQNKKLERRRLTKLLYEAEAMKRRRLLEPAFVNGAMRQPGYVFDVDGSNGPHRRNEGEAFAYHAQFEEFEDNVAKMSVIDRIKAKALEARQIAPNAIKAFEADLDALIAEGPKLLADKEAAVSQHKEAFAGIRGEFDGLKSAIDILSNGAPEGPLPASEDEHKG